MSLRVLHAIESINPRHGGTAIAVHSLATAQAHAGLDVSIAYHRANDAGIAASPHVPPAPAQPALIPADPVTAGVGARLRSVDVVHVHGTWLPFVASVLWHAHRAGIATVLTPHGTLADWAMSRRRLKKRLALACGWNSLIRNTDVIHALNPVEARMMAARFPGTRIEIAPNCVPPTPLARTSAPGPVSARPYVLFLSHLNPHRRPEVLIEAFAIVSRHVPDLDLVLAGAGCGVDSGLRGLATKLGLEGRVRFAGPVYDAAKEDLLRNAICLCHPTHQEACSMTLLEAMARGVPVVTTPEAQYPAIESDGAGFVVPADAGAWAEAIFTLATRADVRSAQSAAGTRLAARFHNPELVERRMRAMYFGILEPAAAVAQSLAQRS